MYLVHFSELGKLSVQELEVGPPVSPLLCAAKDHRNVVRRGSDGRLSVVDLAERRPRDLVRRLVSRAAPQHHHHRQGERNGTEANKIYRWDGAKVSEEFAGGRQVIGLDYT